MKSIGEQSPCKVLLVDDHPLIMEGIRSLLSPLPQLKVCGMAKNGTEAVALAASLAPHIVVLDLLLPKRNGVEIAREILQVHPEARIIIYTADEEQRFLPDLIHVGIMGHVRKSESPSILLAALESVRKGEIYLSFPDPGCRVAEMLRSRLENAKRGSELDVLSPREKEIFKLLAECLPIKEIATKLFISQKTVETHKYSIYTKLQLSSTGELVKMAIHHGIIKV